MSENFGENFICVLSGLVLWSPNRDGRFGTIGTGSTPEHCPTHICDFSLSGPKLRTETVDTQKFD